MESFNLEDIYIVLIFSFFLLFFSFFSSNRLKNDKYIKSNAMDIKLDVNFIIVDMINCD